MITHHVCGVNSSILRKYTNAFPKEYTYCSKDPNDIVTGTLYHQFPIEEMENTNDHCSVSSKYYPTYTTGGNTNVHAGTATWTATVDGTTYSWQNTNVKILDRGTLPT